MVFIVITTAATNSTRNEQCNLTVSSVQQTRRGRNAVGMYSILSGGLHSVCSPLLKNVVKGKNETPCIFYIYRVFRN